MQNRKIGHRFRAMNTDVAVTIFAELGREAEAAAAIQGVKSWFDEVESRLSRFRPESDLSKLNRAEGNAFQASPMLREVLGEAVAAAEATNGLFDPTMLPALMAAGYDRSFELLGQADGSPKEPMPPTLASWRDIEIDAAAGTVRLPKGCAVDLGGIAKGWTVDKAAERLHRFADFAVDAGGDLVVRGSQAGGAPWTVGVQNPFALDRDLLVLTVRNAGVATSTTARRHWVREGQTQHHIIDPRTGSPAATGVTAVTVISRSVARSEVLAKTALVLGSTEGRAFLQAQPDAEGLLVLDDETVVTSTDAFGQMAQAPE